MQERRIVVDDKRQRQCASCTVDVLYNRVEWFSTFLRFSKSCTFLLIRYIFSWSIPKNRRDFKNEYFFFKCAESFLIQYIKEQSPSPKRFWSITLVFALKQAKEHILFQVKPKIFGTKNFFVAHFRVTVHIFWGPAT